MELMSVASGSSGNCICIGSDRTHILIDAGISGKRVENGLAAGDLSMRDVQGICITHEHSDHIQGVGVLARRYGVPIYTHPDTWKAMLQTSSIGKIDEALFHPVYEGQAFQIGDLEIEPVAVSHDAAHPLAYLTKHGHKKIGVVTDLGVWDEALVEAFEGLDALLLEANHDIRMLELGPYPYPLKRRILGERGHLSNESSGKLLSRLLHDGMKGILLGHLSKENNFAELAFETVKSEITFSQTPYQGGDFPIAIANRDMPTPKIAV